MQNELSGIPVNRATSSSDDSENKILLYEEFVLWNPKNGKFSAISLSDKDKCINKVETQTAKFKITSRILNAVPRIRVRKNLFYVVDKSETEQGQTSEEEVKKLTNENIQDSVSVDNSEPGRTSEEEIKKLTNDNIQVGVSGQTESNIVVKIEDTGELQAQCEKPVLEICIYKRFECYKCKKICKSHYHVQKHIYQDHNGTGFYECRMCKLAFTCSIRYGSININLYKNLKHDPCDLCRFFVNFGCAE